MVVGADHRTNPWKGTGQTLLRGIYCLEYFDVRRINDTEPVRLQSFST